MSYTVARFEREEHRTNRNETTQFVSFFQSYRYKHHCAGRLFFKEKNDAADCKKSLGHALIRHFEEGYFGISGDKNITNFRGEIT